jgi:uncharacterized repeat protein (TIGR01451 family)
VALNDTPNVRFYNNTVMKNLTTATAITSNGQPAPAGLSTSTNSDLLQATLPVGSPSYSNPLLFNNIFWDNRAGTRAASRVEGLGAPGDATPINQWDLGNADAPADAALSPTNSVLQVTTGTDASPTNSVGVDPSVVAPYDVAVTFNAWRNNPAFLGAIMISADLPPNQMGDYHLSGTTSPAYNLGAASKAIPAYQQPGATRAAPANDVDNQPRPLFGAFDAGADEFPGLLADLSVTMSDGLATVQPGQVVTYTITVSNAGPSGVGLATVTDTIPAALTGATWTCTVPAATGYACGAASGSGNIGTTVSLPAGGTATFTLTATVAANATGNLANTVTVTPPAGTTDPTGANNSATDTDAIVRPVDLAITVTDGATLVNRGAQVRYTIVVSNNGPNAVTGATVTDNFPGQLLGLSGTINWTCATTGGASCGGGATGSGSINRTVNMPAGSTITFTTTSGSVTAGTLLTALSNTATVAVPAGFVDTNPANNSATDTDTINGVHVGDLDWTSANTSATQWSASVTITVHDANHSPVSGVAVAGTWVTLLGSGSGNCTTNASGQCTVTRTGINRLLGANVAYLVTGLTSGSNGYQITLNHDPDSGAQASNGSTITANRPVTTPAVTARDREETVTQGGGRAIGTGTASGKPTGDSR